MFFFLGFHAQKILTPFYGKLLYKKDEDFSGKVREAAKELFLKLPQKVWPLSSRNFVAAAVTQYSNSARSKEQPLG